MGDIVYVKIDQNVPVYQKEITLKDIGTFYCSNQDISKQLESKVFYTMTDKSESILTFAITKVYEIIHQEYPDIQIENLGEQEFIVEYMDNHRPPKALEYGKVVLVSLVMFIGAAFTIMTFNEDVSIDAMFDQIYKSLMGKSKEGASVMELFYCIGLPIGIMTFYNHFHRKKSSLDPTPLQVEMRTYEEDMNRAVLKNASREGKTHDVD